MNKFVLAENPMSPTGGTWVIHLPTPIAIIEVVEAGEKPLSKKALYALPFNYINPTGFIERYELRLYHYFNTKFGNDDQSEILAIGMLNEACLWYKSYLKWENNQLKGMI
jgi:hypothetical protein